MIAINYVFCLFLNTEYKVVLFLLVSPLAFEFSQPKIQLSSSPTRLMHLMNSKSFKTLSNLREQPFVCNWQFWIFEKKKPFFLSDFETPRSFLLLLKKEGPSPEYVDYLSEKNMYPNAYMDFLRETKFTFSAFFRFLSTPPVTQIWTGPRTKSKKEDAASPILARKVKIVCFFFSAVQNTDTTTAKQMGGVSDDDDLLSVDDGHSSHHFSPQPSQSLAATPASKSMRKSSPRKWKMTPLMGLPPTKATRSRLTAAEISAVTMEKIYWALASRLSLVGSQWTRQTFGAWRIWFELRDILAGLLSLARFPIIIWWILLWLGWSDLPRSIDGACMTIFWSTKSWLLLLITYTLLSAPCASALVLTPTLRQQMRHLSPSQ